MIVNSKEKAWLMADSIFPTDYIYDSFASERAGYPVYTSTQPDTLAWISDLNTGLEVNLPDGKTVRIHIKEPVKAEWNYDGQY